MVKIVDILIDLNIFYEREDRLFSDIWININVVKLIVCYVIKKEIFVVKLIWFDDMIFKKVCNIFFFIYSLFSWRLI